jgi:SAM-dependent methyltransferase
VTGSGSRPDADADHSSARRLFNRLAWAVRLLDPHLTREHGRVLRRLDLDPALSVLDAGAGTGNLAAPLAARGHSVVMVDFAERMLLRARRRLPSLPAVALDLAHLGAVRDRAFDIVGLAYVLHGMPPWLRMATLRHAARIARRFILVIDYPGPGPWIVRLVEWVEGPHYRSFVMTPPAALLRDAGLEVIRSGRASSHGGFWLAAANPCDCPPPSP